MKIAHLADTHIKNLKYHGDYRACFEQMYEILREQKVDCIVHCGDIAHTKTQISPEFVEMTSKFFSSLADIAPTYIILGNHDGNLKNSSRQDAITPIVEALDLPTLHLLKNSGETDLDDNFCLNVLSVFDRDGWKEPTSPNKINIALYHGSISNCQTDLGWIMEYGDDDISIFKGFDFAFLGDIHKRQAIDKKGRYAYCGSTIQQNHGETNDKGFTIWTINSKNDWNNKHYTLENPRPFITIELTPTGKIPRRAVIPNKSRLRLVSNNNLPLDVMRRAVDVARHKFGPESISFLNRASGKRGDVEELTDELEGQNLRDPLVQEELISEYLKDYQAKPDMLSKIYELNARYNQVVEASEDISRNVNWKLINFEWSNLFNYGSKNSINFRKLSGINGIFGKNFSGKSSIIDSILFTMFNTTSKNERKNVNVVNQNRDFGEGKLTIEVGQKVYTIHRKVTKYTKKSKEGETVEAKTDLDFDVYDPVLDETTSLNGTTRNKTDANIRRHFGTIDDFLVSSMSSQNGALSFINEGSTKRKEIIAKFLDLEFFDKKFKLAKESSVSSKEVLKKLSGRDYEKEIQTAQRAFEKHKSAISVLTREQKSLETHLATHQALLTEINLKILSTPAETIDIARIQKNIRKNKNLLFSLSDTVIDQSKKLHKERERKLKISELMETLDHTSLTSSLETIIAIEAKIVDFNNRLEVAQEREKLLEGIPCGSSYPSCKFIRDAHFTVATIPEVTNNALDSKEKLTGLKPVLVRDHLNKYNKLNDSLIQTDKTINELKLLIERSNMAIERINTEMISLRSEELRYQNNREAIENLELLLKDKEEHENNIKQFETKVKRTNRRKINLYKLYGSTEQKIETINEQKLEYDLLQSEYAAYDLFMRCMHSNGIAYDIIKKKLPVINYEIAKILANVVEFEVFFETSGNKFDIFIKHPQYEARPIEMASGAEKTMAAMAIRLALLSVSSLPKGDLFILDEPGVALDEENMAGFIRILELVKVYFKNVLLISHLDSLKDCVDMQIVIEKENGFAKVNQ